MKNILTILLLLLISLNVHAVFIEIITDPVEQSRVFINADSISLIEIRKDNGFVVSIIVQGNTYGITYKTKAEALALLDKVKTAVGSEKF